MKYQINTQNRTFRKDMKIIFSGIKSAFSIMPKFYLLSILTQILPIISSYFSLYMSALLINAIAERKSLRELLILAGITVGVNFVLAYIRRIAAREFAVEDEMSEQRVLLDISKTTSELPYMYIEDPEIKSCTNLISYNEVHWRGHTALIDYTTRLFTGLFQVIASTALTISMFKLTASGTYSGFLGFINSRYSVILIIGIILFGAVSNFSLILSRNKRTNIIRNENKDIFRKSKYYTGFFTGSGAAEIRIYNESDMLLKEISDSIYRHSCDVEIPKIECKFNLINTVARFIMTASLYVYIGAKAFIGTFPIGNFVLYRGTVEKFVFGVTQVVNNIGNMRINTAPYLELFFEYKDLPKQTNDGDIRLENISSDNLDIEFKNVNFMYPRTDRLVIKDASLRINHGEKIAVVGENGSGKTTFIKLLCGLYPAESGEINVSGFEISKYNKDEYRKLFAVVFQDFQLFAFGLGENVACMPEYDSGRVMETLEKSGLSERLKELSLGLDTPVSTEFDKSGVIFSGGEMQKIAISRSLYKDAQFIILDEPTAALDPISEAEIYSKFNEMVGDKTAIYISHRLSSCRFCDKIVVFDNGKIVQVGSHDELVSDVNGKYYELWHAQAQYYA